jgi:glycosyltransferase involved in cell wall biosynthesis
MNAILISPYVPDHHGGGERYFFDVALSLVRLGYSVSIGLPSEQLKNVSKIREKYEDFIGASLSELQWVACPVLDKKKWWQTMNWTRQFDLLYYVTDGSIFPSLAGRSILHVQVPLQLSKRSWAEKLKLKTWGVINTNSAFTKSVIEPSWGVKVSAVHTPLVELVQPVSEQELPTICKEKQPIILTVGRIFRQLHSKRQDVLVAAFQELVAKKNLNVLPKLVCIGAVEDEVYFQDLQRQAKGLDVTFVTSATRQELEEWYRKAMIYWHAAGYGIDESVHPERVEHFGISPAEAMLAGAVPLVVPKGGLKEVVGPLLDELGWQTPTQLADKTAALLLDDAKRLKLAQKSWQQAQKFGRSTFQSVLKEMILV